MSTKKFETALCVALGFIIFWLFLDREEKKQEIAELKQTIDENENLNETVKNQLKDLIQNNQDIDPQIASELGQIAALIEIKHESGAILKLAKIIENLMGQLYKLDPDFKTWLKSKNKPKPVFADFIEYAKVQKHIDADQYHILGLMKNIRNEEAHELDVKKDKTKILVSFVSGMTLILGLSKLIKLKTLVAAVV